MCVCVCVEVYRANLAFTSARMRGQRKTRMRQHQQKRVVSFDHTHIESPAPMTASYNIHLLHPRRYLLHCTMARRHLDSTACLDFTV